MPSSTFLLLLLLAPFAASSREPVRALTQDPEASVPRDASDWKRLAVEAEFMGRDDEAMMARLRALQLTDLEQDRRELARLAEDRRGLSVTIRVPMPPELDPDKRSLGLCGGDLISCASGRIATATDEILVWDEATGAPVGQPIPFRGDPGWIELSPDGERLAVYDVESKALSIVHLATSIAHQVDAPVEGGWNVAWSPDGKWLASCVTVHDDETEEPPGVDAYLCDGFDGSRKRVLHVDEAEPLYAAFSRDGAYLAVGGARILRVADGAPLDTKWPGPMESSIQTSRIRSWRSSEDVLDVITDDGILCSYDAETERWRPTFQAASQYPEALRYDADRRRWIVAVDGLSAMIVPERMGERVPQFQADALPARSNGFGDIIAISPDGLLVAEAAAWDVVCVWDTVSGERFGPPLRHDGRVSHVEFTDTGRLLTASDSGLIRLWDCDQLIAGTPPTPRGLGTLAWEEATDHPSARGLALDPTHVIEILRPGGPSETVAKRISSDGWVQLESSPNGRFIAGSGESEGLLVWDLVEGGAPRQVMPPGSHAWFTFDASGTWLLVESRGQVEAWELAGERRFRRPAIAHTWGGETLQPSHPVLDAEAPSASWVLGPAQFTGLDPNDVLENALVQHQWGEEWVGLLPGDEAMQWFGTDGEALELESLAEQHTSFEPEEWLVAPGLLAGVAEDSVALFRTPSGETVGRYLLDGPSGNVQTVRLGTHRLLLLTRQGIQVIDTSTGKVTARYPAPSGFHSFAPIGDSDQVVIRRESYGIVPLDLRAGTVGKPLVATGLYPTVEAPFEGTRRLVIAGSALWCIDPATDAVTQLRAASNERLEVAAVRVPEDQLVLLLDGLWLELRRLGTGELVRRVFVGIEGVPPFRHVETQIEARFSPSGTYLMVGGACSVLDEEDSGSPTWQPGTFRVLDSATARTRFSFAANDARWDLTGPQILASEGIRRFIVEARGGSVLMTFQLPGGSSQLSLNWKRREIKYRYGETRAWSPASGAPVPIPIPESVDITAEPDPRATSLPDPHPSWTPQQRAWWKEHGPSHQWLSGHVNPGPDGLVLTGTSLLRITPEGPVPVAGRRYPTAAIAHNNGSYTLERTRLLDERRAVIGYRIDGENLDRTILDFGPSTAPPLEGDVEELLQEWSRRLGLPAE